MKKRTKIELIIFAIVAVFYLGSLFVQSREHANNGINTESSSVEAFMETVSNAAIDYAEPEETADSTVIDGISADVSEDGSYTDRDSVAMYIAAYGHLPGNFITKSEAKAAGWISEEGNLAEVCPGKSIGGDRFGNYEGSLPDKNGRKYFECDINYDLNNGYRGGERIIYSNDGLIYYTADHYKTFEKLYGDE